MDRMIINCFPDGTVEYTLRDNFLNPLPGERRHVERLSEIEHDDATQRFRIKFLLGPYAGKHLTLRIAWEINSPYLGAWIEDDGDKVVINQIPTGGDDPIPYISYEEAVAAEIAFVEMMRAKGARFLAT